MRELKKVIVAIVMMISQWSVAAGDQKVHLSDEQKKMVCAAIFHGEFDYDEPMSERACLAGRIGAFRLGNKSIAGSLVGKLATQWVTETFYCEFRIENERDVKGIICIDLSPSLGEQS